MVVVRDVAARLDRTANVVELQAPLLPGDDATSSVILLIGMAVGVDYSLFYLRREREEVAGAATAAARCGSRRPPPAGPC